MTNNFLNMLSPQMVNNYNQLLQQVQKSGNPQAYMEQRFGNDPLFSQGYKILNEQGIDGLNKFILSQFNR